MTVHSSINTAEKVPYSGERRKQPPLKVMMVTRDINDPDNVIKQVIDYSNRRTTEWVCRHSLWALRNNKTVLLLPYEEETDYENVEDHDIPDFDEQEDNGEPEE